MYDEENTKKESKYWCFTINNPEKKHWELLQKLYESGIIEYMIINYEEGEEGTPHIQGYVCFFTKRKAKPVRADIPNAFCGTRITSYHDDCVHYHSKPHPNCDCKHCQKIKDGLGCRLDGPYVFGDDKYIPRYIGQRSDLNEVVECLKKGEEYDDVEMKYIPQFARYSNYFKEINNKIQTNKFIEEDKKEKIEIGLSTWQEKGLELIGMLQPRQILWIVGIDGQEGKSHFAAYLESVHGAFLTENMKSVDQNNMYKKQKLCVFDFVRENDEKISYKQLESYSNGRTKNTKYQTYNNYVKDPKVVVFSNWFPEVKHISLSRWVIYRIMDYVFDNESRAIINGGRLDKIDPKTL